MESLYLFQDQLIRATDFLFRRNMLDQIEWDERLIGLIGAKGVGKTTMMLQHLRENTEKHDETLYVTMDNVFMKLDSLFALAQRFYATGGKLLYIDEIHKYPGWGQDLKNIYDLLPQLKVVFSGSSLVRILSEKADLSRRAVIYHVPGLSYREFLQILLKEEFPLFPLTAILADHEEITRDLLSRFKPLQNFQRYLHIGYYPFFLQSEEVYGIKLNSTINYILENEIATILSSDARTVGKFRKLLQMIAENVPFQPNISLLAKALEINRNTMLKYLSLMDTAEITQSLFSSGSFYGKLTKPGKILLAHPNLFYSLHQSGANSGGIRESFFVNQLRQSHKVELSVKADFLVDDKYTFEVGGQGKSWKQIAGIPEGYLVVDDTEAGTKNKIPLWLFGFLY